MALSDYDSAMTGAEIETALRAAEEIQGLVNTANNGRVLAVENGHIIAKPVTDYVGDAKVLVAKTITANGVYLPLNDNADGYNQVTVSVVEPRVIAPILKSNAWSGTSEKSYTFDPITVTASQTLLITVEIKNYTGTVTLNDPTHFNVLYSNNTTGTTRMIITNSGVLENATLTISISSKSSIFRRVLVFDNTVGISLLRSEAQSDITAKTNNSYVTVSDIPSGYLLYICFDNHPQYGYKSGDLDEQWYCRNGLYLQMPLAGIAEAWPTSTGVQPATIYLKMPQEEQQSVEFVLPQGYSDPNICELAVRME